MEVLYTDPFYNNIIYHLSILDLYNLSLTCKYYHTTLTREYINQIAIYRINSNLKQIFNDKVQEFKQTLSKSNGSIVGLFLKKTLLNIPHNEYTNVDIHTYIYTSHMTEFLYHNNFRRKYYVPDETMFEPFMTWIDNFEYSYSRQVIQNIIINYDAFKIKYWYQNNTDHITISFDELKKVSYVLHPIYKNNI
jgi:hypothetical protein